MLYQNESIVHIFSDKPLNSSVLPALTQNNYIAMLRRAVQTGSYRGIAGFVAASYHMTASSTSSAVAATSAAAGVVEWRRGCFHKLMRNPPNVVSPEEVEAVKLNKAAGEHFEEGRYAQAVEAWGESISKLEAAGKAEEVVIIAPLNNLACAKGELGDGAAKVQLLERALAVIRKHYGEEHPQYAIALSNLGAAHGDNGDPATMRRLLIDAIEAQRKIYKRPDHPKIARTMLALADAEARLGNFHEQLRILEQTHPIVVKHCGNEHPQVGVTLNNLANAHGNCGDHFKRRDLLEEALDVETKTLGPLHPQLAITLTNLGDAEGRCGKPEKQKAYLERAISLQTRHFGSSHPSMVVPLCNYAAVMGDLGNHVEARIHAEKAVSVAERHCKPTDRVLAIAKTNLACSLVPFAKQQQAALDNANAAIEVLLRGGAKDDDPELLRARRVVDIVTSNLQDSATSNAETAAHDVGDDQTPRP
jgi:tetratricopeptide (TPR) repeat protein